MRKGKNLKFLLLIFLSNNIILYAQQFTLNSPGEINKIQVYTDQQISYQVWHRGVLVLEKSPISITIDGNELGVNPKPRRPQSRSVEQTIRPVIKVKKALIQDEFNELEIPFRGGYSVIFRAYDDGIAYRITTSLKDTVVVNDEQIIYNFPQDHRAAFPIADDFFTHYERTHVIQKVSELANDKFSCLPVLIAPENGYRMVITEADLYDYPGFYLKPGEGGTSLQAIFPKYPKTYSTPNDKDVIPVEREDYLGHGSGSRVYPWRLIAIADNDSELLHNELVYKLSRPLQLEHTDWIKPGKSAWDWYNDNNIYGVDFESGINTDTYKYYIDFASQFGLSYIVVEIGWYDITTNDLIHPLPAMDMESLVAYGKEKNVGLILGVTWKALKDNFEPAFDRFEKWGIKAIKVDQMQRDDQWMVKYYEKVARAAAEHKMLVDFHSSYKPTGLRRAYPNVITTEGVSGQEQNKWEGQGTNPENNLIIPFSRMVAGPMDYSPGAMRNAQKQNFHPSYSRPMSLGTRCHQLAMYVIYESPLQMLADNPSHYLNEDECMQFLAAVPTVWDDLHVLEAEFGSYVLVARRSGEEWYVGAMTDWSARDMELNLDFLAPGSYTIQYYQDGVNAERYASDYKMIKTTVTNQDKISIHMAGGGGWAARITRD
ncbi:MAG: alpha-glucosidase [Cyclobacteriaceae bacterium]|nr:MAG: alpha-glucosidase [Cyclobacteriaceae bacterium]